MVAGSSTDAASERRTVPTNEQHQSRFQDGLEQVDTHSYLALDGEGEGDDETLPKAKRLMIDSRSMADSVSVIVPPGGRFLLSAPGASAMIFVPDEPAGFDRGDRVRGQVDILFHVQVNDGGVLGIKVDLFHASDWHAGDENLAAWLESADVRESGVHFVGGTANGHARAGLHREPDNGGDAQKNKRADGQFDVGLLHAKTSYFSRLVRSVTILSPKLRTMQSSEAANSDGVPSKCIRPSSSKATRSLAASASGISCVTTTAVKSNSLSVVDDHFENGVARRRVEAGGRFIEKHQFGTRDERSSECKAFLHSAGHLGWKMIGKFFQSRGFLVRHERLAQSRAGPTGWFVPRAARRFRARSASRTGRCPETSSCSAGESRPASPFSKRTSPASGVSRPARHFRNTDFPVPLRPSTETMLPRGTTRLTEAKTTCSPKCLRRPVTSRMGGSDASIIQEKR